MIELVSYSLSGEGFILQAHNNDGNEYDLDDDTGDSRGNCPSPEGGKTELSYICARCKKTSHAPYQSAADHSRQKGYVNGTFLLR